MKRNSALFGASVVAGVAAATGLIVTGATSQAASDTAFGVSWSTTTDSHPAPATGAVGSSDGLFTANATASGGVSTVTDFTMPALGFPGIGVKTWCENGKPEVQITGGKAAGTYTKMTTVSAAAFTGYPNATGSVTLLAGGGSGTIGASYELKTAGLGDYINLGGVSCAGAPSSTTTSPTSSPTSPTSSTTPTSPTSSTTPTSPTSSTTPTNPTSPTMPTSPTGSTTPTGPTSPTTGPTSTPTNTGTPTNTEPPTQTPTVTTTLPVTG